MAGFTDFLEQALLDHIFEDPIYTPAASIWIGITDTTPTEAGGNFVEESAGSYARVLTDDTDWSAATGGPPTAKTTISPTVFPTATADWKSGNDMAFFGLFDLVTVNGGNLLAFGAITTPKAVQNGDTATFAIGDLTITLE